MSWSLFFSALQIFFLITCLCGLIYILQQPHGKCFLEASLDTTLAVYEWRNHMEGGRWEKECLFWNWSSTSLTILGLTVPLHLGLRLFVGKFSTGLLTWRVTGSQEWAESCLSCFASAGVVTHLRPGQWHQHGKVVHWPGLSWVASAVLASSYVGATKVAGLLLGSCDFQGCLLTGLSYH